MRKIWIAGLILVLCLTAACSASPGDGLTALCRSSELDLSAAEVVSDQNGHGGFHGDGTRLTVLAFKEGPDAAALEGAGWKPLPLDETTEIAVFGVTTMETGENEATEVTVGPYIPYEEGMEPIPRVLHGYGFFEDRYPSDGPEKEKAFLDRGAFNFTVALYDSDTDTLYYCEVDT